MFPDYRYHTHIIFRNKKDVREDRVEVPFKDDNIAANGNEPSFMIPSTLVPNGPKCVLTLS